MSAELMNKMFKPENVKLLLLGDSNVGKSSLLLRFADNSFTESSESLQVDFKKKTINISGRTCHIKSWDPTEVQLRDFQKYQPPSKIGIILVCDLTNRESFENLKNRWFKEVGQFSDFKIPVVVIGTKSDLKSARQVSDEELGEFSKANDLIPSIITSSKDDINVSQVFGVLSKRILHSFENVATKQKYTKAQLAYINTLDAIWDKNIVVDTTPEQKIIDVLKDYTKNDSSFMRIFTGHWNRNHVEDMNDIVKSSHGKTAAQLLADIEKIKNKDPAKFNRFGTVATLIEFIQFRFANPEFNTQQQKKDSPINVKFL